MAKYYRRRIYYKKGKYNIENRPVQFKPPTQEENGYFQNQELIVPPSNTEGVRQVARLTISLTATNDTATPLFWALVYLPEGTQATSALFPNATTLFEPSAWVLNSGVADPSSGPIRISSRLRKNLNAGDRIYLLTATSTNTYYYQGLVRYAIKYN